MFHRRPAVKFLLENRPDNLLTVSGLGSSTWDVTAAGDDPFTSEEGAEIRVALVVPSSRAAQAVERLLQSHSAATLFTTSVLVAENASDMAMLGAVRSAR